MPKLPLTPVPIYWHGRLPRSASMETRQAILYKMRPNAEDNGWHWEHDGTPVKTPPGLAFIVLPRYVLPPGYEYFLDSHQYCDGVPCYADPQTAQQAERLQVEMQRIRQDFAALFELES